MKRKLMYPFEVLGVLFLSMGSAFIIGLYSFYYSMKYKKIPPFMDNIDIKL